MPLRKAKSAEEKAMQGGGRVWVGEKSPRLVSTRPGWGGRCSSSRAPSRFMYRYALPGSTRDLGRSHVDVLSTCSRSVPGAERSVRHRTSKPGRAFFRCQPTAGRSAGTAPTLLLLKLAGKML